MRKLFFFIIVLGAFLYLVLGTNVGLRMTFFTLQHILPGKLYAQRIQGKLLSHVELTNLKYEDVTTQLALDKMYLAWQLHASPSGYLTHMPILNWQADINARDVNFNYNEIKFKNLHFNLASSGVYHSAFKVDIDHLEGKVNDALLNGKIALDYHDQLVIKNLQLNLGQASLIVTGFMNEKWHLIYSLNIPELSKLIPSYTGKLTSTGNITGQTNEPVITAQSELSGFTSDVASLNKLIINANGKLMPLNAHLAIASNDLFVSGYKVKAAQGNVTVSNQANNYKIVLNNGQFTVPAIKLAVQNLFVNALYKANDAINWDASLTLGDGKAALKGSTSMLPKDNYASQFSLSGSNLLLSNSKKLNIVVSPMLYFQYSNNVFSTKGTINIPSAKIVSVANNKVVKLPNDVVYINDKNIETTPILLANDININLGDDIQLDYDNLKTKLVGSLHLVQTQGGQLTATGTLSTKNGSYNAFGKELKIKVGKVIYVGNPIENPGLDIEGTRSIKRTGSSGTDFISSNKISVGVKVTGTLNQPHLSLISQPMMSQNDILSYLLFDTSASNLSIGNSVTLMNMATSLNGDGPSSGTINKIQKKIDKLGISVGSTEVYDPTSNTSSTASTIGISKKIGRDITISYHASPFNNLSVFDVQYKLNKYLVLRTQASNLETTADIIYEIEKKH